MLVRPIEPFISTAFPEQPTTLGPRDLLDSDDPHVAAHREMFVEVVATVRGLATNVEQATAAPGETRKASRPKA